VEEDGVGARCPVTRTIGDLAEHVRWRSLAVFSGLPRY
jgi:hypothetical protein